MSLENNENFIIAAAGRPSIVEYFGIQGLYGYRSISLASRYAATVVIAKNGAGKTTLLGALDAFLKSQYGRLAELDFKRIECRLHGVTETLTLERHDLDEILEASESFEVISVAKTHGIEPNELAQFIFGEYNYLKQDWKELRENAVFRKVFMKSSYTRKNAEGVFDELQAKLFSNTPRLERLHQLLREALDGYEVVYLPTYRRIELSLPETEDRSGRPTSIQSRLGLNRRGLPSADIQFGLSDISRRLEELNQEMLVESNQGYREVSANIIDDLINGAFEREGPSLEERPTKESLNLFFSRLRQGRKLYGFHGSYSDFEIPDVERIYREETIPENSRKFLTYFLGKLNTVMQKTRDVEGVVEEFVRYCNRYLAAPDESVTINKENNLRAPNDDCKVLTLERRNLGVTVSSVIAQRPVPLDSLSSGEKQMISLFARLYLWPGKKIVLIDEPELSLSIDWQRKILLDVVSAKDCAQVVAITHSPFVFDNELEPFAREMQLRLEPLPQSNDDLDEGSIHA